MELATSGPRSDGLASTQRPEKSGFSRAAAVSGIARHRVTSHLELRHLDDRTVPFSIGWPLAVRSSRKAPGSAVFGAVREQNSAPPGPPETGGSRLFPIGQFEGTILRFANTPSLPLSTYKPTSPPPLGCSSRTSSAAVTPWPTNTAGGGC